MWANNDGFSYEEHFVEQARATSSKKQGDFVRFLVNAYYIDMHKLIEEEKRVARSGVVSNIAYRSFPLSDDVARIIGRIAEEAMLIDQKHVQGAAPFSLVEKPLIIPAMVGTLLQRFFFEEQGVFISSTTLEAWASKALGMEIRLSRFWLVADFRVQQLLFNTKASRLVSERSACQTGIHAINLQARSGGPLQSLWNDTYHLMCSKLNLQLSCQEISITHFLNVGREAVALRRKIDSALKEPFQPEKQTRQILYSTAEPELCACIVYHACFCNFKIIFESNVHSRERKEISATVMKEFFHGCLNLFTCNRYDERKIVSVFDSLDAVVMLADGRHLSSPRDLKTVCIPAPVTYLQRAQLLSCDQIAADILCFAHVHSGPMALCQSMRFSEMDVSEINIGAMYSFDKFAKLEYRQVHGRSEAEPSTIAGIENCEDWENYSEDTMIILDKNDEGCERYILSWSEREARIQIYSKLYGYKQQRSA